MTIISRSMFSADVGEEYAQVGQAITEILEFANQATFSPIDLPLWVPSPSNRRLKKALNILDEYIYGLVAERRQQPSDHDLLSTLMHARDEDTGEVMDDKQLRDEVLITFFAGHETTALLLTWTWYILSQQPQVEERFHTELARTLAGHSPRADDVPSLSYTQMMIDEVLRLYSPVSIAARDVVEDDEIDGYRIPAGSMVTVTPYITHRHPEFWEQPETFAPERFSPEHDKARPKHAYYPFGAGPRICIGKYFALQEAILVLAEVAQRYRLRPVPGLQIHAEWQSTLRPNRDVLMTLESRS
jgi:cytochrome P450